MRFRRIYWVTEQLDENGLSEVTGVYTSIPDLIDLGIGIRDVSDKKAAFRLNLCELDSTERPILTLVSPDFERLAEDLKPILESGEISQEEYVSLQEALRS